MFQNIINFLYNLDRSIASLFGAKPQETISSEVGRHAETNIAADILEDALNKIQPGHTDQAIKHADALNKVDDGKEM